MKNNYKQLEESRFLEDLKSKDLLLKTNDPNKITISLQRHFLNLLKKIRDYIKRKEINVYLYIKKRLRCPIDFWKSIN